MRKNLITKEILTNQSQLANNQKFRISQKNDIANEINLLLQMSRVQETLKLYTYNAAKPVFSALPLVVYDA